MNTDRDMDHHGNMDTDTDMDMDMDRKTLTNNLQKIREFKVTFSIKFWVVTF